MSLREEKFDYVSPKDREKYLPSNCFTLKRFGNIDEGIQVSFGCDTGLKTAGQPHIAVGSYGVTRDKNHGCTIHSRGTNFEVRRAFPLKIVRDGKRTFYRLKNPGNDQLEYSIIKVFLAEPFSSKQVIDGHALSVCIGLSGALQVIANIGDEALIVLERDEVARFFFADGHVRVFRQEGNRLVEEQLTREAMYQLRIADAKMQLAGAQTCEDEKLRIRRVRYILSGMADLFRLTSRNRGNGTVLRKILVQEFFRTLSVEDFSFIRERLIIMCKHADWGMVRKLRNKESEAVV